MTDAGPARPWHRFWPGHLPLALDYPRAPAWWLLERNLPRFAARVAIRELCPETLEEGRRLSYAELWRAARGVATGLTGLGVAAGTRVGLCLPNSAELVIGYYATWCAGGVVVPANPSARESEIAAQLGDAGVALVVGAAGSLAEKAAAQLGVPFVELAGFRSMETLPPAEPRPLASASDVAVLLYTGGTTGVPKGAMLTHGNLVANTVQFAEWYAFAPGDEVALSVIPMYHSGGMSGAMNVPLYSGATLLAMRRFAAGAVARAVERYRATRLFGVPTMFIALLNDEAGRRADYSTLRACRTNAAPLPPSVKAAFDALVGREVLVEGYGLTETSPLTHANPIGRARAGSIGIPLPDTDARIVDLETGAEVPAGASGELLIRGPQVMRGYWKRPEETAQALREGWFATGDVAVMDAEGYFAIVDRKKDLINTAGFKVWPREVEETIYAHEAVRLAVVVGVPDDYRGEAVKAFVVLKEEWRGRCGERDLVEFCKTRLTPYKVPRAVEFRAELPMSGAGKLLRRTLRHEGQPSGAAGP
ncbi:MAG: long-chain fatty acid--CoA ligase [Candidatus Rokubacteria bacterium]|nr:long-chain fatty acid--CoA ligase [Candidatus Rokubacteria bacterium]MBI3107937.1 long-chain fatty acid--CoA ligase [Candidatus Rokubacteria bacterium]